MTRMRWMKWWPSDFASDPAVRMCSLAARGLWVEMIGLAHAAEPYGHVLVNGRAPTAKQLASMVGSTEREIARLLAELEDAGVFSRADDGAIYSRRMVRDKAASDLGRQHGKAGGNPILQGGGLTPPDKSGVKLEAEREKEEEEPPSLPSVVRSPRGGRLPPDWTPSDDDAHFALSLGLDDRAVAANFRDYWHAKAGKDATKLDWPATWRGWCRREAERRGPKRATESRLAWMLNPGAPA